MSEEKHSHLLLIENARQVVSVCNNNERFKRGKEQNQVHIHELASVVVGNNGKIEAVGAADEIKSKFEKATFKRTVDATGKVVLPGFCDGHSHPVWSGNRVDEMALKLAGATYMDIHKMGGGINKTVNATRQSSEEILSSLFQYRLNRMLRLGTTLLEAKSGYGLNLETEVKMLRVIQQCHVTHPIDIVANYCGAHSVPKGKTAKEAAKDIIETDLPAIQKLKEKGEINPELIDVFCETGVFEREESREILQAGQKLGLKINFHGDELNPTQSAELAGELKAMAVSHLEHISDDGIKAMRDNDVVGVLLPTTAYVLRIDPPPARRMIKNDVIVALGSDFNPNAHCLSMPHVMNLACILLKMTMKEALVAATINAAASMGKSDTHGSIEVGKFGDMVILDAEQWESIIYEMVDPPIDAVVKSGIVAYER